LNKYLFPYFLISIIIFSAITTKAGQSNYPDRREVISLSGESLQQFFGKPIENLSVFAASPDGFEPVPFQVDERYRKGDKLFYAYTGGKHSRKDPDPNFDRDDEIVFWSADAGQKVSMDRWPANSHGVEIVVDDPISGAKVYVYVLAMPGEAPRSSKRYVKYDSQSDNVEALFYDIKYPDKHKIGFVDMSVSTEAGGSATDFIDEAKYRVDVKLAGTIIPYELNKEEVHSKVVAYIDGPVRVRRKVRNYIEMWLWLGSTSYSECVYTPAGFSVEIPVIGFSPIKGLTNLSTRWALELDASANGMVFKSDKNPDGAIIDGELSDKERELDYSPPEWIMLTGAHGTVLRRPGKLSDRTLYLDLYYMDNSKLDDPPEVETGQMGASGYFIPFAGRRGMKMRENIVEYYDILPNYAPGDETRFIERARRPLIITAREVAVTNPTGGPAERPEPKKARKDEPSPTFKYVGSEATAIESQVMPVIVMSSDNGLGGGLMYVHANPFNSGIRLTTQAWYTVKSYGVVELILGEEVPREGSDWAWYGQLKYRIRPGRDFYGLGNDSDRDDQTNFYDEVSMTRLWAKRRIFGPVWLGAWVEGHREYTTDGDGDWCPNTFKKNQFPDLLGKGAYWTNRIGAFILHDTRDSYYIPTKGGYRMLEYYSVAKWLGSDWNFEYWYLDIRQFIPIRKPRADILALRLQAQHAEGGPIPFYELAIAGSEYTMRGYFEGRWRDRDMISINTEWRHNLWKIFDMHFFYDIGRVYNDMFEEGEHMATELHEAYGTGFRITIPPNIVMRGDIGWSDTDQVFYFNWGQTF